MPCANASILANRAVPIRSARNHGSNVNFPRRELQPLGISRPRAGAQDLTRPGQPEPKPEKYASRKQSHSRPRRQEQTGYGRWLVSPCGQFLDKPMQRTIIPIHFVLLGNFGRIGKRWHHWFRRLGGETSDVPFALLCRACQRTATTNKSPAARTGSPMVSQPGHVDRGCRPGLTRSEDISNPPHLRQKPRSFFFRRDTAGFCLPNHW